MILGGTSKILKCILLYSTNADFPRDAYSILYYIYRYVEQHFFQTKRKKYIVKARIWHSEPDLHNLMYFLMFQDILCEEWGQDFIFFYWHLININKKILINIDKKMSSLLICVASNILYSFHYKYCASINFPLNNARTNVIIRMLTFDIQVLT